MISKELTILNKEGFHARPAQFWVQTANKFNSKINVKKEDGDVINGKSILGLVGLELTYGTKITIEAEGPDEVEAITALEKLIESKFGEELCQKLK